MAEAPKDRSYDPMRRPDVYYKGDQASDDALYDRAYSARIAEHNDTAAAEDAETNPRIISMQDTRAMAKHNSAKRGKAALKKSREADTTQSEDFTVADAQAAKDAGNPVDTSASVGRFVKGGQNDKLDADINADRKAAAEKTKPFKFLK